MKQLKDPIIGQGRSGHSIHGNCLKTMQDMYKIIVVTDLIEERRKSETLKWYEKCWDLSVDNKEMNAARRRDFYRMLYRTLAEGAPLEITPVQVLQQIAVIEEGHRQDKLSRGVE